MTLPEGWEMVPQCGAVHPDSGWRCGGPIGHDHHDEAGHSVDPWPREWPVRFNPCGDFARGVTWAFAIVGWALAIKENHDPWHYCECGASYLNGPPGGCNFDGTCARRARSEA